MFQISLVEDLKQDIKDIDGIINFKKYGLTSKQAKIISKGIIKNLQNNIEELLASD